MEKLILHKAATRGHASHGWLDSYHSFSFGNYYDPEKIHFGALRVLNDDTVAPGMGFGKHPHENMEIVSIPLLGDLEHRDSMGNVTVIKQGDIQVMSAGTGISHSEQNHSKTYPVKFLQIWIIPNKMNVPPRYDQVTLKEADRINKFQQVLSPNAKEEGVWIYQDAWFHLGKFQTGKEANYQLKKEDNGIYIFVINGTVKVNDQSLDMRDGLGLSGIPHINVKASADCELLLMEVPMKL